MVQTLNARSNGVDRVRQRAELRRLEILRAAARAFRRRGFAETGMREIAAEADVSPAAPHQPHSVIGYWNLFVICYLLFVIWDLLFGIFYPFLSTTLFCINRYPYCKS